MKETHTTFFANNIKPINFCGKNIGFIFKGSKYIKPDDVEPLKVWEHNLETCDGCKANYKRTIKEKATQIKAFPFCCEQHNKLIKENWFNIKGFENIPKQYANKLFFSWFQIMQYIDTKEWKIDVFDYLEHIIDTFGEFPLEMGEPLYLSHYIEELRFFVNNHKLTSNELSNKELKKRLNEVNDYLFKINTVSIKEIETDINVLTNTYEKWLKIFPFEISFFAQLKNHFDKNIPILKGNPRVNKYSGKAKFKIHTKNSLIEALLNTTNNLITQINTSTLFEKGLLTEPEKIKLELIVGERKQKLKQGYVNNSQSEETRYRNILKDWFKDEKKFINEITPFVKDLLPHQFTLSDLITHQNRVEIVKKIKIKYRNIQGKRLKLLLIAFQDLGLIPKERIVSKFYRCCKNEFDWDIKTYVSMNDYKYNEVVDKTELNEMKTYLASITKQ